MPDSPVVESTRNRTPWDAWAILGAKRFWSFWKLLTSQTWASIESWILKTPMMENLKDEKGQYRVPVVSFDLGSCIQKTILRREFQGLGQWRLDNDARAPSLCFATWDLTSLGHLKSISKDVNMFQPDSVEVIFRIFRALCKLYCQVILPLNIYGFLSMSYDPSFKLGVKGSVSWTYWVNFSFGPLRPLEQQHQDTRLTSPNRRFRWVTSPWNTVDFGQHAGKPKRQIETNAGLALQAKDYIKSNRSDRTHPMRLCVDILQ